MKKAVLFILGVLLAAPAVAQVSYDTVTATVRDPDGQALAGARYSMRLVDAVGQPVSSASTPDGEMFNAKPVFGNLDASGSFSVGLVPNTILTKPSGTRWLISIESPLPPEQSQILTYEAPWSINYYATITASVDLSAQLSGLASNVTYANLQSGQATFAGWLTGTADHPTLPCGAGQHEGYFYTSSSALLYQCYQQSGSYAWREVGGSPGSNLSVEYNGSKTNPILINQSTLNFLNAPSAGLDAGYQAVLPKPDANGGWGFETPSVSVAQSITPVYPVPMAGQNIIMLPYSCSGDGASFAIPSCGAAPGYSMQLSIYAKAPFGQASITDTGWAYNGVLGLPSFVSSANVTAVYGGVTSWWTGGSKDGGTCGGPVFDAWNNGTTSYPPGLSSNFPYTSTNTLTEIDGGSPTTFNYTTGYFALGNQQSTICAGTSTRVAIPYLVVYYTGTAPPATNNLMIAPPLTLANNTIGLQWPYNAALDTGTSTAYVASIPWMAVNLGGGIFQLQVSSGSDIWITPANTNTTTTPTLNLDGFGAVSILGNGASSICVGDIVANQITHLVFGADSKWHLLYPQPCSGGGMVYPGAGIPLSTGTAWGTSLTKFGSQTGVATSADPGSVAGIPMQSDGAHGQAPSAGTFTNGDYCTFATATGLSCNSSGAGGAVSSVSNSDGSLTVTPTTGAVVASLNTGHSNTFTAPQTFSGGLNTGTGTPTACNGAAGGCFALTEGGTAVTPAAGFDTLRADSVNHCIEMSLNGGAEACIGAGSTGTVTDGSGTTTANQLALSTTTTHAITYSTAIPNGTTATTQTVGDNTTKVATDAFVLANAGSGSGAVTNLSGVVTWTGCTSTTTYCTPIGTSSSVTIAAIPGMYTSVIIDVAAVDSTSTGTSLVFAFNGDTTAADYRCLKATASAVGSVSAAACQSGSAPVGVTLLTAGQTGGTFTVGGGSVKIPFYASTAVQKQAQSQTGNGGWSTTGFIQTSTGWWASTAAITSITITTADGGNLSGAVAIYGVK